MESVTRKKFAHIQKVMIGFVDYRDDYREDLLQELVEDISSWFILEGKAEDYVRPLFQQHNTLATGVYTFLYYNNIVLCHDLAKDLIYLSDDSLEEMGEELTGWCGYEWNWWPLEKLSQRKQKQVDKILNVLGKQPFVDFYNGMFDDYIGGRFVQGSRNDEKLKLEVEHEIVELFNIK